MFKRTFSSFFYKHFPSVFTAIPHSYTFLLNKRHTGFASGSDPFHSSGVLTSSPYSIILASVRRSPIRNLARSASYATRFQHSPHEIQIPFKLPTNPLNSGSSFL